MTDFDPENPPKTPIYVGQTIPIYIVPDDTQVNDRFVKPSWRKTDWVFRIVAIRKIARIRDTEIVEEEVVDVEWPNKHVDRNIPIENMYGHFTKILESWIPRYTEEYTSEDSEGSDIIDLDSDAPNEEKLAQLLKMLEYLAELRDKQLVVSMEETTDPVTEVKPDTGATDPDIIILDEDLRTGSVKEEWFNTPAKGGLSIGELRDKAAAMNIKNAKRLKRCELKAKMLNA